MTYGVQTIGDPGARQTVWPLGGGGRLEQLQSFVSGSRAQVEENLQRLERDDTGRVQCRLYGRRKVRVKHLSTDQAQFILGRVRRALL